jgi:hypothetical protein
VVTSLALSFADDHLENERVVLGSAPTWIMSISLPMHARSLGSPRFSPTSWIANGTQRCLILEPRNDILRWIPYTRLTSLFCKAGGSIAPAGRLEQA